MGKHRDHEDLFGMRREARVRDSGVRQVFTPHEPIDSADLLFGRQVEVQRMVAAINTPGQHALVYGDRGVGKSSLSNVVADFSATESKQSVYFKRCDRADTFETIVAQALAAVGADLTLTSVSETTTSVGGVDAKIASASRSVQQTGSYRAISSLSPSTAAEALTEHRGLLVIDEVDAISSPEERFKVAEFMKLLSDAKSPFKVMLVGIAEMSAELTAGHPSVQRCLAEIKLARMGFHELRRIVESGMDKLALAPTPKIGSVIAHLSAGYPYFTHLLALKCAEIAIADGSTVVDSRTLSQAQNLAVRDCEESLKQAFNAGVQNARNPAYLRIVLAAATLSDFEFSRIQLREAFETQYSESVSPHSFGAMLKRLVSDDGSRIFRKTTREYLKFSDPRMGSYARIIVATRQVEP